MITHHTQLLNALIEKYELKSYLEIGVQTPAQNFDKIKCKKKVAVDPCLSTEETSWGIADGRTMFFTYESDKYFSTFLPKENSFDLIFIDGLHHADQVKRDFENSLHCLSDNGFIIIHDVLPENEAGTLVPRIQRQWWGDVYKWAMNIGQYDGIAYKTFNIDNGCMLVWKDVTKVSNGTYGTEWEIYNILGHEAMNVTNEVTI